MSFADGLARFNRVATNRVARPVARRIPPLANVVHRGRRTGRMYRTPVLAFRDHRVWTIALTYGPDRDWIHNVLAAGGCSLEHRGRRTELTEPRRLQGDDGMGRMPGPVRAALRALDVTDFLELREA